MRTVQGLRLETSRGQDKNTYDVDGKYERVQRPEIEKDDGDGYVYATGRGCRACAVDQRLCDRMGPLQ